MTMRLISQSLRRLLATGIALAALLPVRAVVRETPVRPVKNIIFCISDGTSLSTMSLARWYARIVDPERHNLLIDPYLSGTVLTHCSDSPIGDSAPTTSTYMNGVPGLAGQVGTYPELRGEADLQPLDSLWQRRPLLPLWQATRLEQGRRVGLVVTCEFPHATPADCVASSYRRNRYDWIAPQMVYNDIDVLFGGGAALMQPEWQSYLEEGGWSVFTEPGKAALECESERVWGLFAPMDLPYDLDRDTTMVPSLEEMTRSAIRHLDHNNDKGFVLMVEGSKVDWAAHANDPVGMATEFLAFDRAVAAAIDFAREDGETVVVVTADHGNSGLALGSDALGDSYAESSAAKLFGPITRIRMTAEGLAERLITAPEEQLESIWNEVVGRPLSPEQSDLLRALRRYEIDLRAAKSAGRDAASVTLSDYLSADLVAHLASLYSTSLAGYISEYYTDMGYLAFTTHGHTAEEVFLACYHPDDRQRLIGFNTNIELHDYLRALAGIPETMKELSEQYYAPHTRLFAGCDVTLRGDKAEEMVLEVTKDGHSYRFAAFTTKYTMDGEERTLPIATVYNDQDHILYLPEAF